MFLDFFTKKEYSEPKDVIVNDDDQQILEAFLGDSQIIVAAQELNSLKEGNSLN